MEDQKEIVQAEEEIVQVEAVSTPPTSEEEDVACDKIIENQRELAKLRKRKSRELQKKSSQNMASTGSAFGVSYVDMRLIC